MFRIVILLASLLSVWSFRTNISPLRTTRLQMVAKDNSKWVNTLTTSLILATSFMSGPVFAKAGQEAKIEIFGNSGMSSPFYADERREDPLYSPYSPYGNGEKSVYNAERKGSAEELKFWRGKFEESR